MTIRDVSENGRHASFDEYRFKCDEEAEGPSFYEYHLIEKSCSPIGIGWTKGEIEESCTTVCDAAGGTCNTTQAEKMNTYDKLERAFQYAGYQCNGAHGHRDYAGTPFSTGRNPDDCAPVSSVTAAVQDCDADPNHHSRLCCCVPDAVPMLIACPVLGEDSPENFEPSSETIQSCASQCDAHSNCLAFEIHTEGLCVLRSVAEATGCFMDLYVLFSMRVPIVSLTHTIQLSNMFD